MVEKIIQKRRIFFCFLFQIARLKIASRYDIDVEHLRHTASDRSVPSPAGQHTANCSRNCGRMGGHAATPAAIPFAVTEWPAEDFLNGSGDARRRNLAENLFEGSDTGLFFFGIGHVYALRADEDRGVPWSGRPLLQDSI